jgi:hypothetical protein
LQQLIIDANIVDEHSFMKNEWANFKGANTCSICEIGK